MKAKQQRNRLIMRELIKKYEAGGEIRDLVKGSPISYSQLHQRLIRRNLLRPHIDANGIAHPAIVGMGSVMKNDMSNFDDLYLEYRFGEESTTTLFPRFSWNYSQFYKELHRQELELRGRELAGRLAVQTRRDNKSYPYGFPAATLDKVKEVDKQNQSNSELLPTLKERIDFIEKQLNEESLYDQNQPQTLAHEVMNPSEELPVIRFIPPNQLDALNQTPDHIVDCQIDVVTQLATFVVRVPVADIHDFIENLKPRSENE